MAIRRQVFNDSPPSFTPDGQGKCTGCGSYESSHSKKAVLLGYRYDVSDKCDRCFMPYAFHVEADSTPEQRRASMPNAIEGYETSHYLKIGTGLGCTFRTRLTPVFDYEQTYLACREFVTEYEGAVLTSREENGYDDSDWYALVWDGEAIRKVYYATTRGGGTDHNSVEHDATDEVKAAAQGYLVDWLFRYYQQVREDAFRSDAREATLPTRGKQVRVVRGRKVAKGTEGIVFWTGEDSYGHDRIGIKDAAGEVYWTAASNVEVIDPEDYVPAWSEYATDEQLRAYAESRRGSIAWYQSTAAIPGMFRVDDSVRVIVMAADAA